MSDSSDIDLTLAIVDFLEAEFCRLGIVGVKVSCTLRVGIFTLIVDCFDGGCNLVIYDGGDEVFLDELLLLSDPGVFGRLVEVVGLITREEGCFG